MFILYKYIYMQLNYYLIYAYHTTCIYARLQFKCALRKIECSRRLLNFCFTFVTYIILLQFIYKSIVKNIIILISCTFNITYIYSRRRALHTAFGSTEAIHQPEDSVAAKHCAILATVARLEGGRHRTFGFW